MKTRQQLTMLFLWKTDIILWSLFSSLFSWEALEFNLKKKRAGKKTKQQPGASGKYFFSQTNKQTNYLVKACQVFFLRQPHGRRWVMGVGEKCLLSELEKEIPDGTLSQLSNCDSRIGVFELDKVRRSTDFGTGKLWNVWSGWGKEKENLFESGGIAWESEDGQKEKKKENTQQKKPRRILVLFRRTLPFLLLLCNNKCREPEMERVAKKYAKRKPYSHPFLH